MNAAHRARHASDFLTLIGAHKSSKETCKHKHNNRTEVPMEGDKATGQSLLRSMSLALSWVEDEQKITQECRALVEQLGANYLDKAGNTLLHTYILRVRDGSVACRNRSLPVYIYAQCAVPINGQNNAGDTALHLAARHLSRYPEVFEALIQCGADPDIRNKFAQSSRKEFEDAPQLQRILERYQPTLLQCVTNGSLDLKNVQDCVRKWFAVNTIVQNGETIMDMVNSLPRPLDERIRKGVELLKEQEVALKLAHAAMANDREQVLQLVKTQQERRLNINIRHFTAFGKTPLVCAMWNNSRPVVDILLANGASAKLRVRYNAYAAFEPEDGRTSPILHLALDRNVVNFEIFRGIADMLTFAELFERNSEGNTLFLEALENDRSLAEMQYILVDLLQYAALFDRNARGESLRELCDKHARTDVDDLIQQSLVTLFKERDERDNREILVNLAANYVGADFFHISETLTDEKTRDAIQLFMKKVQSLEKRGRTLFQAIADNVSETARRYNIANFRDKAGYTALIRAIIHERCDFVEWLVVERPELKYIPDNKNRYPLHYAYLLPDGVRERVVAMLIENSFDDDIFSGRNTAGSTAVRSAIVRLRSEYEMFDKDGFLPTDYKKKRHELLQDMFYVEAGRSYTILEGAEVSVNLLSE